MDVSVLAAVGSFVVSERVLKPKATVLVVLGCVLAYDLTTKTHDSASLRVYRGPALLAFTLMMGAYSLRTWRRNGVACDELLFLPGTPHGETHGIDGAPMNQPSRSEGDVAAGVGWNSSQRKLSNATAASGSQPIHNVVELVSVSSISSAGEERIHRTSAEQVRSRSLSRNSSLSSIHEFVNSWDDDEEAGNGEEDLTAPLNRGDTSPERRLQSASFDQCDRRRGISYRESSVVEESRDGPVERFREEHPRITRFGSFFFFRSSSTSTQNAEYAPSGPSVVGAALDLSMPILFNFHLFIEAYNHIGAYGSETPAKILPLIFLSVLIIRAIFPPGRRGRFWSTLNYTFTAPFPRSRFRDSFIGDVLTSLVRPAQDVLYALSYYVTVIYGTVTAKYGLSASGEILEASWILHNVVLPSCALLPLWWRFLQTLRESYDANKRWPYLGNSFKYLSAALVILYGMTHPEDRRSPWWIVCFILTVLYQIWWDVVMDWELLVVTPRRDETLDFENSWFTSIYSVRPNSYILLSIQRNVFQPIKDIIRMVIISVPSWRQIQLRPRRLYKSEAFYWKILIYNVIFRVTWMLCFIPAYRLSSNGAEHELTFRSDTITYVGVLLPVAEILRRTLWGFLHLELQTIKMTSGDPTYSIVDTQEDYPDEAELSDSTESAFSKTDPRQYMPFWMGVQMQIQQDAATSPRICLENLLQFNDEARKKLFLAELSMWAIAFVFLGLWATT